MGTGEFGAIERFLKKGQRAVKISKVWKRIHNETGVGIITNDQIHFTPSDLLRLREYGKHLSPGLDPQFESLAGSRMELADKIPNEKFASDSVFGDLVVLATAGNAQVSISGQTVSTPPGSVFSVRMEALDTESLKQSRVVIIENGSLMPAWPDIRLPPEWCDSVLIYRGHRENMRHVRAIIADQPSENLALYYDFDPEGLEMALGTKKGTVLIPENWHRMVEDKELRDAINQRSVYRRQSLSVKRLKALVKNTQWEPTVDTLTQNELAVMQEHITRRNWQLVAL